MAPPGGFGRSGGGGGRPGGDRGGRPGGAGGARRPFFRRRKSCPFSRKDAPKIDFKDVKLLQNFIPERGKILPRRISGVCTAHQRMLTEAIKRARNIALLPYTAD